jgi:hypothetical protein
MVGAAPSLTRGGDLSGSCGCQDPQSPQSERGFDGQDRVVVDVIAQVLRSPSPWRAPQNLFHVV